ncbi:MAG TPA: glycosyltransferase family 1 protein [Actinomycetota bacterium]|nr:glycosyltransferase family 1 protein [Actinomycetota bacterium]
MRVGIHADPAAHSIPGGVGVYVRRLVDELLLVDGDPRVELILSRFADPPAAWSTAAMIRPQLPFAPLYAAWNWLGFPPVDGGLDVVHATGLAIPPSRGAALVSTIHDLAVTTMPEVVPGLWRRIYQRGLRRAVEESKVLCAVSEATRQQIVDAYSVDPERIVVTPEAPNVTPASPCDPGALGRLGVSGPYILTVGTVEPRKNQVRLVKAFAQAGEPLAGHTLVLAGIPGWGQEQVEAAIDRLRIGHRVVLTGKVTNLDLAALYAGAHVFALPSLYEGFGIPLVEAMSFGVPCVAGSTPALAELAGDAALLCDPADVDGLAAALVSLATDETVRERLSAAARSRAAGYSWAGTARLTIEAYRRAAA